MFVFGSFREPCEIYKRLFQNKFLQIFEFSKGKNFRWFELKKIVL